MDELKISEDDKILIVAPHADDESIGCGGLITKYHNQIEVLLITDGTKGAYLGETDIEIADKRKKEFATALEIPKILKSYYLNIPDREVSNNFKLISKFDIRKYTKIFVPSEFEKHIDHKCLYSMFRKMICRTKLKIKLYQYEVWSPLSNPNYFIDITNYINTKVNMVDVYKSQLVRYNYIGMAKSLSAYRGTFINKEYAEVFFLNEKKPFLKRVFNHFLKMFSRNVGKNKS